MSIWEYANPKRFMQLSALAMPWLVVLTVVSLAVGLVWGFFFTPDDYKQGSTVKIIYLHVPAAMMAINAWVMMLVTSLIWIIRRHHVSALVAKAAAPVGLTFTLIALVTGAFWGQPMWGTWWVWDPRLTSFLILALFYLGYLALWAALEDPDTAADLTAILCLVGSVFCAVVALCGAVLEPGAASGCLAEPGPGGKRGRRLLGAASGLHRRVRSVVPDPGLAAHPHRNPRSAAEGAAGAGKGGMMPELGKYAVAVLGSYAATAVLIAALVGLSVWQAVRMKRALAEAEARQGRSDG